MTTALSNFTLARHAQDGAAGGVLGASRGATAAEVIVTVQNDGIVVYDVSSQKRLSSWALGGRGHKFASPALWDALSRRIFVAVEAEGGKAAGAVEVVSFPAGADGSLASMPDRFKLDGPVAAIYPSAHGEAAAPADGDDSDGDEDMADGGAGAGGGGVVVVYCSGKVAWYSSDGDSQGRLDLGGAVATSALAAPEGHEVEIAVVVAAAGGGRKGGDMQLAAVVVRVGGSAGLHEAGRAVMPRAKGLVRAAAGGGDVSVLWQDAGWDAYRVAGAAHGDAPAAPSTHLQLQNVPLSGVGAAAPKAKKGGKRRASGGGDDAPAGGAAAVAMDGIGGGYVAIVGPAPGGGGGGLEVTVLDSAYGCVHAAVSLADEDGGDTASWGAAVQVVALAGEYSDTLVVATRGAVAVAELELPALSLASVVGAMGVGGPAGPRALARERVLGREQCEVAARPPQVAILAPVWSKAAAASEGGPGVIVSVPGHAAWDSKSMDAADKREEANVLALSDPSKAASDAALAARVQSLLSAAAGQPLAPRVVEAAVARAVAGGFWGALGALVAAGQLPGVSTHPGLVEALLEGHQLALLQSVVSSTHDMPAEDIARVLEYLLEEGEGGARAAAAADAAEEVRAAAEELISAAAGLPAGDKRRHLAAVACAAAAAVDRFTPLEQCLHALVATPLDGITVHSALRRLPAACVVRLLDYLASWVALYSSELNHVPGSEAAAEGTRAAALLPGAMRVVEWAQAVLDAHLTKLALLPGTRAVVEGIQVMVGHELRAARKFQPLCGIAAHMQRRAPLAPPYGSASATYSVELLDLC